MIEKVFEVILVIVPSIIAGVVSILVSRNSAKNEIKKVQEQNASDLQKLMEQHKVDISSLREQHSLDMAKMQQEHLNKLEILKQEHENEIVRKQKELENSALYSSMGTAMNGLVGNILGMAMNSETVKTRFEEGLKQAFDEKQKK